MTLNTEVNKAYDYCQQLAKNHYENFPVASILLPASIRQPVAAIYAFARTADDFADEGDLDQSDRLKALTRYSEQLQQIQNSTYGGNDPIFIALQDAIVRFSLPIDLFEDLLIAFRQDVVKSRYQNFTEVLDYCRFSANPVGRLLLYLQGQPSTQQLQQSDAICSALQLVNFYQDVLQDYTEQNRVYLPQDELLAHGISESDLTSENTQAFVPLMTSLYQRTATLFEQGYPLGCSLRGRLGWEIRTITLTGISVLEQLAEQSTASIFARPRLGRKNIFTAMLRSISKNNYSSHAQQHLMRLNHLL